MTDKKHCQFINAVLRSDLKKKQREGDHFVKSNLIKTMNIDKNAWLIDRGMHHHNN
jgi:hypothetical protein